MPGLESKHSWPLRSIKPIYTSVPNQYPCQQRGCMTGRCCQIENNSTSLIALQHTTKAAYLTCAAMEHHLHVLQHGLQQDCTIHSDQACCLSTTFRSPACLSTLADAHRFGRIVGVLLLRHGGKQQLAQLENRLRDCEVAQFRWWAWASRYRRRKVCIFSSGMSF